MEFLIKYIAVAIVVWRITHIFVEENGPFNIFSKIRKWTENTELFSCIYCLSVWIGLIASIFLASNILELIVLTFFYSAGAILIERLTNKCFE